MGPDRNPRSIGPDKKPRSIRPELADDERTPEPRGTGCRGREAKESELSKVDARSKPELLEQRVSLREVEDVVDVLALREAPEMDRNVVVSSLE